MPTPRRETLEQIKVLLRRDLKLGPDIPIRLELDIRIHVVEPPSSGPGSRPQAAEKEADPERKQRLLVVARELGSAAKATAANPG